MVLASAPPPTHPQHPTRRAHAMEIFVPRDRTALARKIKDLERSNAALSQFACLVSHDLQEPLRTVTGYAQLLAGRGRRRLGPDADDYLSYILDGTSWMSRMIETVLAYSQIGGPQRSAEPTDCAAALERSLRNLRAAIKGCGAQVSRAPLPAVSVPPIQLERIFQNLIGNAIKFHGDRAPQIRVSARRRGKEWVISVRDNGIGIDPRRQPRLFKPFRRLHARGKHPGTGIGLAVCKKIVEESGGRIWVESGKGKGSTFRFTLAA